MYKIKETYVVLFATSSAISVHSECSSIHSFITLSVVEMMCLTRSSVLIEKKMRLCCGIYDGKARLKRLDDSVCVRVRVRKLT